MFSLQRAGMWKRISAFLFDFILGGVAATLFAAWNAAIYVSQVEDHRLEDVVADGRYLEATREVLHDRGGLWFYDESYVISRRRE